ncbi:MAG: hypothetical protein AAF798_14395 [Bacteroidota bacterium]
MGAAKKLSNLQLELLKVFSFDLDDTQIIEIRDLLAKYFADKATEEMDRLWEENSWNQETIQQWSEEHMRTKYSAK